MITGLTGLGASRKSQPNIHNDVASHWITQLYSCLSMLKPFEVRAVLDTNSALWLTDIQAKQGVFTITWPLEVGYSTGGTLSFNGAFTDFTFGAPDIESRVDGSMTITPSGIPTVVAGTNP